MTMKKENHSPTPALSPSDLQLLEQIETWEPLRGELSGIVPVKQVALQYYPDYNPQSASRALRMSIKTYPLLSHALSLVGWTSPKRNFTPRQTAVLAHYLGTP
ncbi:DUF4248 domain-containing protein [uncultured Porphyromonas sp.]|uniref:DUF4248 domain-containing protein n=1 Tax=uncultured Porphyromonas sp. TaxID=159274 RepID=UPI0025917E02|nr:DUF4248 domain-containing protein [uncultured Porphyromonas sp.]